MSEIFTHFNSKHAASASAAPFVVLFLKYFYILLKNKRHIKHLIKLILIHKQTIIIVLRN